MYFQIMIRMIPVECHLIIRVSYFCQDFKIPVLGGDIPIGRRKNPN